ncbi:P1 family peptidase [Aldersonia sp. NBC_00410]|uniref:P1 family peptidase n=1 Tax=Aldersonia sp. NBC_00410 TaxID=2975954 RepID=UPI002257E98C|nr:P1 family peptidase [Aldersonia sp. NBC_00410]MCX5042893.1 P1 family peptidase [Aldersonia sp. NBC_00410]
MQRHEPHECSTVKPGPRNALTDVAGLLVGHRHALDRDVTVRAPGAPGSGAATGCTVVRAPGGATAAVDVRGGGPGTRETDLLDPSNSVQRVHAVLLTGGSAYGLAAADGVMRWLEEHDEGIDMTTPEERATATAAVRVPIVPAAVIFDLPVGDWAVRPTAEYGYGAAGAADVDFARGCVGAGVGARAGALKGGLGTASVVFADGPATGVTVGALVVANPVGSVIDPRTGLPWGVGSDGAEFFGLQTPSAEQLAAANALAEKGTVLNTTIGLVATDAALPAAACRRMATAAHDGLARAVRPAHSPLDGDTMFALATGRVAVGRPDPAPPPEFPHELAVTSAVCAAAALCVERAIVDAILAAESVAGIPAYRELLSSAVLARR